MKTIRNRLFIPVIFIAFFAGVGIGFLLDCGGSETVSIPPRGDSDNKNVTVAETNTAEERHPLDIAMDRDTEGFGPDTRTAAIYRYYAEKWDAELNRIYQVWMQELRVDEKDTLRKAQRAWIGMRDAEIALNRMVHWPAGQDQMLPTMYVSFLAYREMNITRERVLWLIDARERRRDLLKQHEDSYR